MNIYITILTEFLFIASCILLLFKLRSKLGLAPLYILLGSVQYLQALSGSMVSFYVFGEVPIYPGHVIVFSAVLFAVLLIYIKEGVGSARGLILGIIISNFILSGLFRITYVQEFATQIISVEDSSSVFQINYKLFITGTLILLFDFFLLVIIYQFLISKISKRYFFFTLFLSLFSVLIYDAFAYNIILKFDATDFKVSLIGHVIGKAISAFIFSLILYIYLKFLDVDKSNSSFIASQNRDIFSIVKYRKRYLDLKVEKKQIEKKLTSQLETSLHNISDGFVSLDTNWCYTYINRKAAEFLGKSAESLIGKHIWTEFPEGVGRPFYNAYHKAVETQQTIYFEDFYEPFDKWFENRIYPSPDGLTIYFTDITQRKKADSNNQMLLSLIETSDDFVGLANLEGKPIYLNGNGRKIVGLETDEKIPTSISDFFTENYQDTIVNEHLPNILKNDKWNGEAQFQNFKTGDTIPIEMSGFLIKDNKTNEPIALGIVATDISERKETEKTLMDSENHIRTILETEPECIKQINAKGELIYMNPAGLAMIEADNLEMVKGRSITNLIMPDYQKAFKELNNQIFKGQSGQLEFEIKGLKGTTRWLDTHAVPFKDTDGNIISLLGVTRDVTKRKIVENDLIKSEKYLENIINNIGDPVFVKDDKSHMILVNDALCEIFNLSRADMIGKTLAENVPPEEMESFLKIDKQVISTGIENVNEESLTMNENETRIISTKKTRFIDDNGNKFLIGIIRDITERKKNEKALKSSEAKFKAMVDSSPIGIFFVESDGYVTYGNEADLRMTGLTLEETLGLNWVNAIHPEDRAKSMEDWVTAMDAGKPYKGQGRYLHKDGKIVFWDVMTAPVIIDGEVSGFIGMVIDITEKLKSEEEITKYKNHLENLVELRTSELEKEKVKAQSADLMKSAFLATMSHELRTPMNSIIGFTGILIKEFAGPLNDEQKKQLGMVKNSGEHLLGLINDILDISKIEAGKLKVTYYPFNYLRSLEKTVDFLVPQASAKDLKFVTQIDEIDITLSSDERRVEQILLNLLSNAIKFSKEGTILIKVAVKDDMLITQVIDEGIGISKKNLIKLFMPFIQLEAGLSRRHEGTGLGLAICKNLIEKLGGTIHVESQLGKGSNFTFKLPLEYSKNK